MVQYISWSEKIVFLSHVKGKPVKYYRSNLTEMTIFPGMCKRLL